MPPQPHRQELDPVLEKTAYPKTSDSLRECCQGRSLRCARGPCHRRSHQSLANRIGQHLRDGRVKTGNVRRQRERRGRKNGRKSRQREKVVKSGSTEERRTQAQKRGQVGSKNEGEHEVAPTAVKRRRVILLSVRQRPWIRRKCRI